MANYVPVPEDNDSKAIANESFSKLLNLTTEAVLQKPSFNVKKDPLGILIKVENFAAEAIRILSKRSSEDNFSLLAEITEDTYLDTRPNLFGAPELREYMLYYINNKIIFGEPSSIVLIIKK